MTEKNAVTFTNVLDWVQKIAFPLILAGISFVGTMLYSHENKLAIMDTKQGFVIQSLESSAAEKKEILNELKEIHKSLQALNDKVILNQPPQWLLDRLSVLEKEVDKLKNDRKN